ncbi:unnamed protein product [Amoebophrya sp. A25]|nr:unnamed protein product [Amoebophrya sp. A25]|eukprot:GSA25T00011156001.1
MVESVLASSNRGGAGTPSTTLGAGRKLDNVGEYVRCVVTGEENAPGAEEACRDIVYAIQLRAKYMQEQDESLLRQRSSSKKNGRDTQDSSTEDGGTYTYDCRAGVFHVQQLDCSTADEGDGTLKPPALFHEFVNDEARLRSISTSGGTKSFCRRELGLLQRSFNIHQLLNRDREYRQSQHCRGDFYKLAKVDTHVHLAAAMTANHLLDFIRRKYIQFPDEVVMMDKKKPNPETGAPPCPVTLKQVFERSGITCVEEMTVDSLDVQAEENLFDRFDHFNAKYNPFGNSDLRTVFLKSSNHLGGRYFAELTREILERDEGSAIFTEYRVSIYGINRNEWTELSDWVVDNNLFSKNNKWMVQCPRVFNVFKKLGMVTTFQDLLSNVFEPLFAVTIDPSSNPKLAKFLENMSGFDSVDDESKLEIPLEGCREPALFGKDRKKEETTDSDNPPYAYWCYYMHANLYVLNALRARKGLNTFKFRPHCGESGSPLHLNTAFLCADSINHGIQLHNTPVVCYLYYLCQVGCAVSPLSNNALFIPYRENPFNELFQIGLNVSLSTDDPMQFHRTEEPMLEEYSVAKQLYRYSVVDLCEIARNSVLQGGFDSATKERQLGSLKWNYFPLPLSNNADVTNIPDIRMRYRYETILERIHGILRTLSMPSLAIPGLPHLKGTLHDAMALHARGTLANIGASVGLHGENAVASASSLLRDDNANNGAKWDSTTLKHVVQRMSGKPVASGEGEDTAARVTEGDGEATSGGHHGQYLDPAGNGGAKNPHFNVVGATARGLEPGSLEVELPETQDNVEAALDIGGTRGTAKHVGVKRARTIVMKLAEARRMRERAAEYKTMMAEEDSQRHYSRIHMSAPPADDPEESRRKEAVTRALLRVEALRAKYVFKSILYERVGGQKEMRTMATGKIVKRKTLDNGANGTQSGQYTGGSPYMSATSPALDSAGGASGVYSSSCIVPFTYTFERGVIRIAHQGSSGRTSTPSDLFAPPPSFESFVQDYTTICAILQSALVRTFCYERLEVLARKFDLHMFLNHEIEQSAAEATHSDFYSIAKVDNNVQLNGSMTARELLEFVRTKYVDEMTTSGRSGGTETSTTTGATSPAPGKAVAGHNKSSGQAVRSNGMGILASIFREECNIESADEMSVDNLQTQADESLFLRFERLQDKKSPFGSSRLREIFLRPRKGGDASPASAADNVDVKEDFFAELLRDVVLHRAVRRSATEHLNRNDAVGGKASAKTIGELGTQSTASGIARRGHAMKQISNAAMHRLHAHTYCEYRLTILGKSRNEWFETARWVLGNDLGSSRNVKYIIQIPRQYEVAASLEKWLQNLFVPVMEATREPEKYPELAEFLAKHVAGFDLVAAPGENFFGAGAGGTGGKVIARLLGVDPRNIKPPEPAANGNGRASRSSRNNKKGVQKSYPVTYSAYLYYIYANVYMLSRAREANGLNAFMLRPHCGESGDWSQLASAFLLCHGICHGLQLKSNPAIAYIYYLMQIGVTMSPLSNNALFKKLRDHPFLDFFRWGLNVSLSTDMPLVFHATDHPLIEEYTIAQQYWKLSLTDLSEIAQNSVLQSGLDPDLKEELLGKNCVYKSYKHPQKYWNNADKSNVCDIRVSYRKRCFAREADIVRFHAGLDKNASSSSLANNTTSSRGPQGQPQSSPEDDALEDGTNLMAGMVGDDDEKFAGDDPSSTDPEVRERCSDGALKYAHLLALLSTSGKVAPGSDHRTPLSHSDLAHNMAQVRAAADADEGNMFLDTLKGIRNGDFMNRSATNLDDADRGSCACVLM